jgi:MFS transporter, DHA1 family, multidrug resistance protein
LIFGALITQLSIAIIFLIMAINHILDLYGTISMLFLFLGCLGITNPNTAGLTLAPFRTNAGSASALMGALQLGFGSLASFVVSHFVKDSLIPIVVIITITSSCSFIILNIGKRTIKKKIESSITLEIK